MDVLSQVAQKNAARRAAEAVNYNASRQAEAEWVAAQEARKIEMNRVAAAQRAVTQPVDGLAAKLSYSDGSLEDAHKLQMAQKIADQNAAAKMVADNQAYNAAKQRLATMPFDMNNNPVDDAVLVQKYRDSIDPGLAAKWRADRGAFR